MVTTTTAYVNHNTIGDYNNNPYETQWSNVTTHHLEKKKPTTTKHKKTTTTKKPKKDGLIDNGLEVTSTADVGGGTKNDWLGKSGVLEETRKAQYEMGQRFDGSNPKVKQPRIFQDTIPRTFMMATATFFTQNGDIHASYVLGRKDIPWEQQNVLKGYWNNELLAFSTKNVVSEQTDMPTFSVTLTGMRDWENTLLANDYASLSIFYLSDKETEPKMATLMTGMVADVHKAYDGNQKTYVITCQSLAKIMSNVTLTTFTEIMANGGALLFDFADQGGNDGRDVEEQTKQQAAATENWKKTVKKKQEEQAQKDFSNVVEETNKHVNEEGKNKKPTPGIPDLTTNIPHV